MQLLWPLFLISIGQLALDPAAAVVDNRFAEDAALHAVQFVDAQAGWAVGDEGVVWHTSDGGKTWERQATGTRASLRSICFINAQVGWLAGREELAGGGSAGVLLYTGNGGASWQRVLPNVLPGLNRVRFVDGKTGFLMGDGSDNFPSGLFRTSDGGRSWKPVPGSRVTSWLDGDFQDGTTGALAGSWSRLAKVREGNVISAAEVDSLGERNVRGLRMLEERTFAVGDGGLVLFSRSQGQAWGFVDLKLPRDILASWDFYAIDSVGDHVWIVGRPGSVILRSIDLGQNWTVCKTGQTLPLKGIYFVDPHKGWAVGALGTILATQDGGKTWQVQRGGGTRTPVVLFQAQGQQMPLETLVQLGREEGFLATGIQVLGPDPKSAPLEQASDSDRLACALRQAGAASGELLWQFPLPQHLAHVEALALLGYWNRLHGAQSAQQMLRQLVLALRMWRPDVVITDAPAGAATSTIVSEAARRAVELAADPKAFPEQLEQLGLSAWQVSRLLALTPARDGAQIVLDGNEIGQRLQGSPRDLAAPAAAILHRQAPQLPAERFFRLLAGNMAGRGPSLLAGLEAKAEQGGRRSLPPLAALDEALAKALQQRRQLQALVENPTSTLAAPEKLVAQIGPVLDKLPREQGASAAFAIAQQYVRAGQWLLAQETFALMTERYPAHPLTAEAYRWLVQHNTSSEARRRYELGQFVIESKTEVQMPKLPTPEQLQQLQQEQSKETAGPEDNGADGTGKQEPRRLPANLSAEKLGSVFQGASAIRSAKANYLTNQADLLRWHKNSLAFAEQLKNFGPIFANDPALEFCLASARRQLGQFKEAQDWYRQYKQQHRPGPWQNAAAAEHWLTTRDGLPPRPVLTCRRTETRPFLDGDFDDPCWQGLTPVVLQESVGETIKENRTEARFAYDQEFLYLALRCTHPEEQHVPAAKVRPRDADLRGFDRVSILLDLDRDYSTYFQLQVDQRGCVCEDCWGDRSWNPRWFVAVRSSKTSWQIEAAIPLNQLTGQRVSLGTIWACNIVRVLPRRGVQAWSLPANVEPQPQGMGLLIFQEQDADRMIRPASRQTPAQP